MKVKIQLDTMKDINRFVSITTKHPEAKIIVTDNQGLTVNAKSVMGVIYAMEFEEIWCESDKDIYHEISDFVVNE